MANRSDSLALVKSALGAIDPDKCDAETRLLIAQAIHSIAPGPDGMTLYSEFLDRAFHTADGSDTSNTAVTLFLEFDERAASGVKCGITVKTLYGLASEHGWKNPTKKEKAKERSKATICITDRQDSAIQGDVLEILLNENKALMEMENEQAREHELLTRRIIFARDGGLASLHKRTREDGSQVLDVEPLSLSNVAHLVTHCADWVSESKKGDRACCPPKNIIGLIHGNPDHRFLPIASVLNTPVFDSQGDLISAHGYHAPSRCWFAPGASLDDLPDLSENPTGEEVGDAKELLLDDLLCDFPFAGEAEKTHAVAAIILPFVRRMIPGPTPLHLLEAATPGTGKGFLADVISLVATGYRAEPQELGSSNEDIEKRIGASLLSRRPILVFDNVNTSIDSGSLASTLTAYPLKQIRILGESRMADVPTNHVMYIATANNPKMTIEVARRCVRTRLVANEERPWERKGFKHPDLHKWILENRPYLIHACLTLVTAWKAAGRPLYTEKSLGSFGDWAQTMGGVLQVAKIDNFLGNTEEMYELADEKGSSLKEFVLAWWAEYSEYPQNTKELNEFAYTRKLLLSERGEKGEQSQQVRLGKLLSKNADRIIGGYKLCAQKNTHTGNNRFYLCPAGKKLGQGIIDFAQRTGRDYE